MRIADYLQAIPLIHRWSSGDTHGGLSRDQLLGLYRLAYREKGKEIRILETGAGNSTLAFLIAKPSRLISIAPDADLFKRIAAFCDSNRIDQSPFTAYVDYSEWVLPRLLELESPFDLIFMDGGHGWPTVFVDFCYCAAMLKLDGFLVIDDCQLYSVCELVNLLSEQPGWKEFPPLANKSKTRIFRKKISSQLMPDFGAQPYIKRMTEELRKRKSLQALAAE